MEYLILFFIGMTGALAKDILKDGSLTLPYLKNGKFYLGFLGSAVLGGIVGLVVDHSYLTAFLSGYVGFSVIENMLPKKVLN